MKYTCAVLMCSTALMACDANYPPILKSNGYEDGFGRVPSRAEVEICAKYAQDESLVRTSKAAVAGEGAPSSMVLGPDVFDESTTDALRSAYDNAYNACMAKRGF